MRSMPATVPPPVHGGTEGGRPPPLPYSNLPAVNLIPMLRVRTPPGAPGLCVVTSRPQKELMAHFQISATPNSKKCFQIQKLEKTTVQAGARPPGQPPFVVAASGGLFVVPPSAGLF